MKITIDGAVLQVKQGTTILEAAQNAGRYIPTLCYHPSLPSDGSCGLCLVEVEGRDDLLLACDTLAVDGLAVNTDNEKVRSQQHAALKKILAHHPCSCLTCWRRERCQPFDFCLRNVAVSNRCVLCARNGSCQLQRVVDFLGLVAEDVPYNLRSLPVHRDNPFFDRDYNLCIGCGRCVRVCKDVRGIEALKMIDFDGQRIPQPLYGDAMLDSDCRLCCACVGVCPTGALMDKAAKWEPKFNKETATNPCSYNCPAGIDVPLYISLIAEGKYAEALGVIREKVPFPGTLGRVCIHPCETGCKRSQVNAPIAIKTLKRFVADRDSGEWKKHSQKLPPTGKRVAVVGSGPAGLTAAYYLAKAGHAVTVFEQFPLAGGMLRVGIPRYRLPAAVLDAEIAEIQQAGVDIKLNSRVESVDDLFQHGFQAVFLAVGAHVGQSAGIEGDKSPGVVDGATVLRKVSLGEKVRLGKKVAVIGGGNVAIDCARTVLRCGTKEVNIVYRRTRAEMPASPEEVEAALSENVKIQFLSTPLRITIKDRKLVLTCQKNELGEPDESGRRRPIPVKGSEFDTTYDSIIAAIGQVSDVPEGFDVAVGRGNVIKTSPDTLATSRRGVFAGGDAVLGPDSVIRAIAQGRLAASSIDKYLGGSGIIDEVLAPGRKYDLYVGRRHKFIELQRAGMQELEIEERLDNFKEVESGFTEEVACGEAGRCLQCAVRNQLLAVPLPPVKSGKPEEVEAFV